MHLSDTCFVSWPDLQSKKGQKVEEKKRFERQQMKVSAGNKNRIFFFLKKKRRKKKSTDFHLIHTRLFHIPSHSIYTVSSSPCAFFSSYF